MRPRIFIGSSGKSKDYAEAIHSSLEEIAECTPWTRGAFNLDSSTLDNLTRNLQDSDFGVFVFANDDTAEIKGDLLSVPRDNVVYEAGLFSGYLSPERCFIVVPRSTSVHIPTDLSGKTVGYYDDMRIDRNYDSAVLTFCRQAKQQILQQGFFKGNDQEVLRELATEFECCRWIEDESKRVEHRRDVALKIDQLCKTNKQNKHRLLLRHRTGYYVAMLKTIKHWPGNDDCKLILGMQAAHLPSGFTYHAILDAVEVLVAKGFCDIVQRQKLKSWLGALPKPSNHISERINALALS